MNFFLRVIKFKKFSPYMNMAIDEYLLLNNKSESIVLRFYGWEPPSISIGTFQEIEELNFDYIKEKKIPVVRRPTGGKGVYHDNELTYSIIIPSKHPMNKINVIDSYKMLSMVFIKSLEKFGIKGELTKKFGTKDSFCFSTQNYYEVSVNGKKIIGSAQRRKKEGILQQGSIPMTIDYEEVKNIFKITKNYGFSSLKELNKNLEIEDLQDELIKNFILFFDSDYKIIDLTDYEFKEAKKIFIKKYSLDSWNLKGIC